MKKTFKIGSILLIVVALMLCSLGMTSAEQESRSGNITYEGDAKKFVVVNGSDEGSELFAGLLDIMPGDSVSQKIGVKVNPKNNTTVKIYLRAETPDAQPDGETAASMRDFLSQLSMTVKNGGEVIYQTSPDQLGGLKENVLLGEFKKSTETELTVELSAPLSMDNEYANRAGYVDWVFVAEVVENGGGGGPVDPTLPQSGQLWWPVGVLVALGLVFVIVAIILRKRKQAEE